MRRVILKAFGGPEQLDIESIPNVREPGLGQVVIEVEAAGVNYLDVMQRKGVIKVALPFTPGLEGVGRVVQVGEAIAGADNVLTVGQRVAWINVPGSYAERVLVPASQAIPV
ncbi:MAG: alcohol dehydrogenase catalytic domain-containing protein [Hyphomicrobiales bacterium]|nr:alcohol dehydrogenase catalytic domain-containing protein [Hyphomicrobiales bacterium]